MAMIQSVLNQLIIKITPLLPRSIVWRIAGKYVAGETADEALSVIKELNDKKFSVTVDILGEHTKEIETAGKITNEYLGLYDKIYKQGLDCNISVKPSHIGLDISRDCIHSNLNKLMEKAKGTDNFLRIDMESSLITETTIELYEEFKKQYSKIGTVFQAYLHRTENDLKNLCRNGSFNFRLCKGIYKESSAIAIQRRQKINSNYLKLLRFAFENKIYVGIATHDLELLGNSYAMIAELNIPSNMFEFQVLYGVPMSGWLEKHLENGYKVRVYVPYGKDWYEYSIRRLKENPNIAGYILKDLFRR